MDDGWQRFLDGSAREAHGVQVYAGADELADSVAAYFSAGFGGGEPAIAVATPEHAQAIAERLHDSDLLNVADAAATLDSLLDGGRPSRERFEQVIGGLFDEVEQRFPGRRIRVFGEMVDLLCRSGRPDDALALEALWTSLAERRSFALLCAYELDVFDRRSQAALLPAICHAHSHVRPAADPERLQQAVDAALEETLGDEAGKVYALIGAEIRERRVPAAQLALMWVSREMPATAERILASARTRYTAASL